MARKALRATLRVGVTVFAVLLPVFAYAQEGRPPNGQPRNILPGRSAVEAAPFAAQAEPPAGAPDDSGPPADGQDQPLPPSRASRLPQRGPAIEIGDLGSVEGPVAGLLDNSSGGLGEGLWQGIDRATAIAMLKTAPAATPSEVQRLVLRKLLLTAAPPPAGMSDESFNALRLMKLIAGGMVEEAADLALKIDAPNNLEIVRAQAEALILAGRPEMCGDITKRRLDSAEPFWAELRAYCYAIAGDKSAFELTRNVIADQGIVDPVFLTLLDGVVANKGVAPDMTIRLPDALQLAMLQRLKLPIPAEMEPALGLAASLAIAASVETARPLRIAAGEKALRAGILPTPLLAEILDSYMFAPDTLASATALARNEPTMDALARLRAALKVAETADSRAELVHAAFEVGQREGVLAQVALLFADEAAAIFPPRDWNVWSELMVRGLLLAGQSDAAQRWYAIVNPDDPALTDTAHRLALTLALTAPDVADPTATQDALLSMADRTTAADAPPPWLASEAVLTLGLFDALGKPMPGDARTAAETEPRDMPLGRRPAPALMQRIDRAAAVQARGEVAVSVVAALGAQGVRDLAADVIVRLVRALKEAGISEAADALAMEAMLLRPATGA